jgi:hypothetical protein
MDEFENVTLDDITAAVVAESLLTGEDYSDMPELEPLNLDAITGLVSTPENMQTANDNLTGLLNKIEHTLIQVDSTPVNGRTYECSIGARHGRHNHNRNRNRPEIVNYGTIIYSSLPATQNPHVAKWLNKFTQVLETIYEHEPNLDEQSQDDVLSGVLEGLYEYASSLQTNN